MVVFKSTKVLTGFREFNFNNKNQSVLNNNESTSKLSGRLKDTIEE